MKALTLARVSLRSLLLESSWNYAGQQSLGFAAAIDPALEEIYRQVSSHALSEARIRGRAFFNTNPIGSGLAIGVAINLEERLAAGLIKESERNQILRALSMMLASLGDGFFWQSWLPLCSLLSVWAVIITHSPWGVMLLPALFLLIALPVRFGGLYLGYKNGEAVFEFIERLKLPRWIRRVGITFSLFIGVITIATIRSGLGDSKVPGTLSNIWAMTLAVVAAVLLLKMLIGRVKRPEYILYPVLTILLLVLHAVFYSNI